MKGFFSRLFALQPGEERKVFKLALLGLLWSFVATTGLKYADALFLSHLGSDNLPEVYQLVSVGMLLLSIILLWVYHRISSYAIFRGLCLIAIAFYAGAHFFIKEGCCEGTPYIWYTLRIFGNLFLTVMMTSYWTFIDQYLDKTAAKRLFGLFSSTVFIGMILTGSVMGSGYLDLNNIFLILISMLLLTLWVARKIHLKLSPDHEEAAGHPEAWEKTSLPSLVKLLLSSRYSLLIITTNFLIFLLWVIAEFNYMTAFNARFPGLDQQEELTQFLGQWVMIIAAVNLIFGLFIYGRLVHRLGVGTILLYTPLLFFCTFAGWLINDSLVFPMMGFFIVEGSLYIIDDSNFNLLLKSSSNPMKSRLRVLIESFFEPAGMLTAGWILSFPDLNSKLLGLVIAVLLFVVAITLKVLYFNSKRAIAANS